MNSDQTPLITDPVTEARPVAEAERIAALDVLRGVAIFGIFMVNIPFFAMPLFAAMDPTWLVNLSTADQLAWSVTKALFELKFISLFSILFGVGLILQMVRLESRGGKFVPVYVRRLIALAVIGLLHGLFIWYGDILFMYALAGVVLLMCRGLPVKTLLMLGGSAFVLGGVMYGGCITAGVLVEQMYQTDAGEHGPSAMPDEELDVDANDEPDDVVVAAPARDPNVDDRWQRFQDALIASQFRPEEPAWEEAEMIAYKEGPFLAAFIMRAFMFLIGHVVFAGVLLGFLPRIIGLFLLGAALMKLNLFAADKNRWHWSFLGVGVAGLLIEIAVAAGYAAAGWELTGLALLGEVVHYFSSLALTLGYIGATCLIVHGELLTWLTGALAAAGRMALTNYIGQSVITTFIMYWWGLALFGEFAPAGQLALVVAIFAGQIVFSVVWLRVFSMGPLEWLWRAATYGRLPALVRRA